MTSLVARLNTRQSMHVATAEEKKYGAGIYMNFGEESEMYKTGTFKKVIDEILKHASSSEDQKYREIARDAENLIAEQGPGKILEVKVYDPKNDKYVRNVNDETTTVMSLDDKVKDYIIEREIANEGETVKVDYLDIYLDINASIGGE